MSFNVEYFQNRDGTYPVDLSNDVAQLLRSAQHNEFEEHDDVYKAFEETARQEGFQAVASSFHMVGAVEKIHGERFGLFADLLEQKKLFSIPLVEEIPLRYVGLVRDPGRPLGAATRCLLELLMKERAPQN